MKSYKINKKNLHKRSKKNSKLTKKNKVKKQTKNNLYNKVHTYKKKYKLPKNINSYMYNDKKNCVEGILAEQENIFTFGKCRKNGGGSCNDNVTPLNPYMAPKSGFAQSIPGPFEGNPWGGNVSSWPGVNGVDGGRNFNNLNTYDRGDIQLEMKNGGKKTKKGGSGGLFSPNIYYNLGKFYNGLVGTQAPVNPLPYKDQMPSIQIHKPVNY